VSKGFKRISLVGSEELFRPTRPEVVETVDTITEVVEAKRTDKHYRTVHLTPPEVELLLEAIQIAKYPDRPRPKPPLEKHDRLDALRDKLQPRD
jgi:hypothetical protein